ncbi:MAG: pyruvate kinase [Alphaproteobacteria bacterium]|nr:pyruvate kinase [Alphaproteobacteria bacterium]
MMRHRKAKIVATLGPASSDAAMIRTLFEAGVDVFRLNFSHGAHDEHKARLDAIRAVEAEVGRPIAILADLQGPKIRVGAFQSGKATLNPGARFRLDLDPAPGDATRALLPHPEIFAALKPETDILLDDGRIRLKVETIGADFVETIVVVGGEISDRKGVNLPRLALPVSPLTEKDRRDLYFALELGVDWIALSFVQRPEDVAEAKKLIQGRASVMTKLEKPAALAQLDEIIQLSDALMVARGDLGVELDPEDVPIEQKRIVRDCRRAGKPVVVATQMLESMIRAPAPTRAEASDVATAVYDGADALMLSAETASGSYPREAVTMMNRIIERVERDADYRRQLESQHADPEATAADAITAAASQVADTIRAACIVTYTSSGSTALRAARERPSVPVLALTPSRATARRLALTWGVHCVETEDARSFTEMVEKAAKVAREQEIAKPGERIVVTAGVPFGTPGATNILRIAWVGG